MIDAASVIVDLLQRGHEVRFQARGDSMHPAIRDDDYLHVMPIDATTRIRRGEVVVMLAERGLTVHRVLAQRGEIVIARGDNAPDVDPPLHRSQVIGRVVKVERKGKMRRLSRLSFAKARRILRRLIRRS